MSFPRFALLLILGGFCFAVNAPTQQTNEPVVDNAFVQKEFGTNCSLGDLPALKADFDGDGVEDIVIPAHCTSPMMDQAEENYKVIDPYNSFFGYGNPKITTQFSTEDPERRAFSLLIIHGAGADAWHSAAPKAKFMIVNLPYKSIYAKKLIVRKKEHIGIYVNETGGDSLISVVFWDGRKYRYEPMGSNME
jgi:hypothetical protein